MHDRSERLRSEIVAALPEFASGRLDTLGVDVAALRGEIDDAVATASRGLAALLALPFDRQADTPLEELTTQHMGVDEVAVVRNAERTVRTKMASHVNRPQSLQFPLGKRQ